MFSKTLDMIKLDDLQALIDNKVAEQQTVEYKKGLYLDNEQAKDEFRADVSSFANASGGHFVIGMTEEKGSPIDLCGMEIPNKDAFILKMEQVLQTRISPRIPGYKIRIISISADKAVVIIRIPQSFAKPHQITVNHDDYRFWSRNSAGKYRLSVDELRSIILQSETLAERIKKFRLERLGNIVAGETPVPLKPGARVVVHMIPLSAFNPAIRYDMSELETADRALMACPSTSKYYLSSIIRHNLDGVLSTNQLSKEGLSRSYMQVFRNGILEMVEAESINWAEKYPNWSRNDELQLINVVERGKTLHKYLGVEPPVVLFVTLVGVRGFSIDEEQRYIQTNNNSFDRDMLVLPDMLMEDLGIHASAVVRPILDAIWNAGGYARCLNYNTDDQHISLLMDNVI